MQFWIFDGKNVMMKNGRNFETYSPIVIFLENASFREYDRISFLDKSADMAEFHEKMLGKVVYG